MDSFLNNNELLEIGFKKIGSNVKISRKCSIYSPHKIEISDNVRIDDFCILSGKIEIGNNIHIAASTLLYGGEDGIVLEDFVALSSRVAVYAITDDYSGEYMTNSVIDDRFKNIISKKVIIKKHSIVGTGSTLLPGVVIEEGCSIGAMSLVTKSTESWKIYVGIPVRSIGYRSKNLLKFEKEYLDNY